MTSYITTQTSSFTVTHARYIASKVATDLKRFQRFYDSPIDNTIKIYSQDKLLIEGNIFHDTVEGIALKCDAIEIVLTH